ncbi:MAG: thermonuclease family protein [Gammaproteobacteria bacterium]|uniref:thermonuclease family protein n=1 Tax=Rhodoferax sp. TaxID=50421 RepID=UPI0017DB3EFB|nr:thermonuclease family protein [Rhodoferax sp.]MBU3897382.1 thermonuclease family protein [Gammaproteobacteria bacterium]MBA3057158.1 thermonuclease family protein [Rhodoferax sp.]MBU3999261.1 thermonuclease family protein [Gammaproteobacteria bacterium]MBU4018728.1 thermonuclease family protein [Gammaproteobacteria bacterium]MBU4079683.1 thermonuclease family protein [Gammaproteobacteria bacterium]
MKQKRSRQKIARGFLFLFLLAAILVASHPAGAKEVFAGTVTFVTDGDTLWVRPHAGGAPRKLRIEGIDAPEICQDGGEAAREVLKRRVLHQQVVVTVRSHDDYGRGLARIRANGSDLGAELVRTGQAWSYRWRRDLGPYAAEEAAARAAGLGLFAATQAELPRAFRQRHGPCLAAPR